MDDMTQRLDEVLERFKQPRWLKKARLAGLRALTAPVEKGVKSPVASKVLGWSMRREQEKLQRQMSKGKPKKNTDPALGTSAGLASG